ncbi:unnamed protein product [Alternaria alternata]|jgi:hypothetical protein
MSSNASDNTISSRDTSPPTNHRTTLQPQMNYQEHHEKISYSIIDRMRDMIERVKRTNSQSETEGSRDEADVVPRNERVFTETHNHWMKILYTLIENEEEDVKIKLTDEFRRLVQNAERDGIVFNDDNGESD